MYNIVKSMQLWPQLARNAHFLDCISKYSTVVMIWKYAVKILEINSNTSLGTETSITSPLSITTSTTNFVMAKCPLVIFVGFIKAVSI